MNLFKDKINLITKNYKNGIDMVFSKIANCSNDIKIINHSFMLVLSGDGYDPVEQEIKITSLM